MSGTNARAASLVSLARIAWRESRTARRRLLLYMSSIAIGVAALVAIDSYASNVTQSVREQSRALMGGDVQLTSRRPFPAPTEHLLDSLAHTGIPNVRGVSFPSMAMTPRTGGTRLVQVRAVGPGYPWYGHITTSPRGEYERLQSGAFALVDPALLIATGAQIGDTLTLGVARFVIRGTLDSVPGSTDITAALGPRVYVPQRYIESAQLLTVGATAEYSALLELPSRTDLNQFASAFRRRLDAQQVRIRTVTQSEQATTNATEMLSSFIGIIGIISLMLGGIGVASGVRAFVARKIDTVAILRCLGAT